MNFAGIFYFHFLLFIICYGLKEKANCGKINIISKKKVIIIENIIPLLYNGVLFASRLILPIFALLFFFSWIMHCRYISHRNHVFAALETRDGVRIPITSTEASIGRNGINDIVIPHQSISKTHAVLTRTKKGFRISDTHSSGGIFVNGEEIDGSADLHAGDIIRISDEAVFRLVPRIKSDYEIADFKPQSKFVPKSEKPLMLLLTLFQITMGLQLTLRCMDDFPIVMPLSFLVIIITEWIYFLISRRDANSRILIESLAFFLMTLGIGVCAASRSNDLLKQLICAAAGFIAFLVLTKILCNIELTMKLRYVAAGVTVALLFATLLLGSVRYGAKNWIDLKIITIQPSEFAKVLFIFAGCATLERLLTKQNLTKLLIFSAVCMGALVLMRDFGAVAIFFVTMMVIIIMRLGDLRIVLGLSATMIVGGLGVLTFIPYVNRRFSTWLHAWDDPYGKGWQQVNTMMYSASGGLFGVGGKNGYLRSVPASDTDLVFGMLSEEWGAIIAIIAICSFVLLALYAIRLAKGARSAYYSIAVCAVASQFLFQLALNVFGALDILPLTGVTMPFVSNGGSSIIASFCLLAFFKAAEIKQIYTLDTE